MKVDQENHHKQMKIASDAPIYGGPEVYCGTLFSARLKHSGRKKIYGIPGEYILDRSLLKGCKR